MLPAPEARLTRQQLAHALTEAGYPISHTTLASKATRGGGPPFQHWGPKPIYRWADALKWAEGRISPPVCTTSEAGRYRPRGRRYDTTRMGPTYEAIAAE